MDGRTHFLVLHLLRVLPPHLLLIIVINILSDITALQQSYIYIFFLSHSLFKFNLSLNIFSCSLTVCFVLLCFVIPTLPLCCWFWSTSEKVLCLIMSCLSFPITYYASVNQKVPCQSSIISIPNFFDTHTNISITWKRILLHARYQR